MNENEFVSRALLTEKRPSLRNEALKFPFRDRTALVATDGHRLHLVSGLPEATPAILGVTESTYPEYHLALPKTVSPILSFTIDRYTLKGLKALLKAMEALSIRENRVRLIYNDAEKDLMLHSDHDSFSFRFGITNHLSTAGGYSSPERVIAIVNLKYLLDGFIEGVEQHLSVTTEGHVQLTASILDREFTALVCGLRY